MSRRAWACQHARMDLHFYWNDFWRYGGHLLAAFLLTLPIAWERESSTRMMGLRTLPLVALASCAWVLVGSLIAGDDANAQSRLLGGLIAGIGFIGGGAVLKSRSGVHGTATAASIWATGVLGAAIGYGMLEIAVLISLITLATLLVLRPIERLMGTEADGRHHLRGEPEDTGDD